MLVSNLSTYKFGKAKPEAGAQPPCARVQEWDGTTQDLLWLFQWDFPTEMPCSISSERNMAWWVIFSLSSCSLCDPYTSFAPSQSHSPLPMALTSSTGALLHHQRCSRTLMTALAQCRGAVWVPAAPGTSPCTTALAGGSQPGRSCPCPFPSPDPVHWLRCCSPAKPSEFASSTATPLCLSLCPLPNSFWLLEAPSLSPLCSTAPLAPGRQTPART